MVEKELERTYLLKFFPEGLEKSPSQEILDIYIPKTNPHPKLRIRKNGDRFEMTKKDQPDPKNASHRNKRTIILNEKEYLTLSVLKGLKLRKTRYFYKTGDWTAEIGVFHDDLEGLVLADFEFENEEERDSFVTPDFCLAEVTEEEFAAGGKLCGKKFSDIKKNLDRFGYKKLKLNQQRKTALR